MRGCHVIFLLLSPAASLLLALQRSAALQSPALSVAQRYVPLRADPNLFEPALVRQEWLHPRFVELAEAISQGEDARSLVTEESRDVYSFPLLCDEACDRLFDEVEQRLGSDVGERRRVPLLQAAHEQRDQGVEQLRT